MMDVHLLKALSYRELTLLGLNLPAIVLFSKISEDVVMRESTPFDTKMLETFPQCAVWSPLFPSQALSSFHYPLL